jgi:hypothetical protein
MSRTLHFVRGSARATYIKPSELLRRAMAQIDAPEKWARGDFYVDAGSCALGAMATAFHEKKMAALDHEHMHALLLQSFKEAFPDVHADSIPDFNDDPNITWEDLMGVFEKTATRLEEQGE